MKSYEIHVHWRRGAEIGETTQGITASNATAALIKLLYQWLDHRSPQPFKIEIEER